MKLIKMLGLAAVAASALVAVAGTGVASATVLCKNATSPCSEIYSAKTLLQDEFAEGGTWAVMKGTSFTAECTGQRFESTVKNAGGSGKAVSLNVGLFTVDFCPSVHVFKFANYTVEQEKEKVWTFGSIEINHTSGADGEVTAEGIKLFHEDWGKTTTCWYGIEPKSSFGTFDGGSAPAILVDTTLELTEGSVLCGAELHWTGEYQINTPTPIYVAKS